MDGGRRSVPIKKEMDFMDAFLTRKSIEGRPESRLQRKFSFS